MTKALKFWKSTAGKSYDQRQDKRMLRCRTGKRKGVTTKKQQNS